MITTAPVEFDRPGLLAEQVDYWQVGRLPVFMKSLPIQSYYIASFVLPSNLLQILSIKLAKKFSLAKKMHTFTLNS